MKIRPSYKQQGFMPLVVASVTAHTILFTLGSSAFKPAPEYAVVKAPSSMEIVLLEEPKVKKVEQIAQEEVLTAEESPKEVVQEQKEIVEEVEEQAAEEENTPEPVLSAEDKGAIAESEPEYLRNPAPVYPVRARERGWEGLVRLNVFVDKEGNPVQVGIKVSSGHKVLDQAALKAVQRWKFKPASLGKMSFSTWIEVPIRFALER